MAMLSVRLIRLIEQHADELTRGLIADLRSNPKTPSYHQLPHEELHRRVYRVYRKLGDWLGHVSDDEIESTYHELGRQRCLDRTPASEVVYALILTKYHLRDYIRNSGLVDSAVDLYQEQELHRMVGHFFDKAIFCMVQGYEREMSARATQTAAADRG